MFDFVGVIMDTEPVHFACWQEVLRPYGIEMDWERDYRHIVGVADFAMIEFFGQRADPPVPTEVLWERYSDKKRMFTERALANPPVIGETRTLLAELQSVLPLAIVSSSGREEVVTLLEAAELRRYFQEVVCREDVERPKPDPQPYQIAAERLGASRPLVVEDSDSGVASGVAAGFDVARVGSAGETAAAVRRAFISNTGRWKKARRGTT